MDFTPVPRRYAWTAFRSSLEADWACTLDSLSIKWEYEPLTVTLPSGEWYVPDFWLPELRTYIEVKGDGIPRRHKPAQLAKLDSSAVVLLGLSPSWLPDINGWRSSYTRWQPVSHSNTPLGKCLECSCWGWVPLERPITCRGCGELFRRGHLAGPGEIIFHTSDRSEWTVVH